nr:MAG TPA: tail length tape measure protein [Caudoviricetes sp.]
MLLDELLIKIGIDADSQAMREFEQFLNSVSDGTESAVDSLGAFAKSIEDIVSNATAQAREMPEFAEFFQSIEQLQQETANLSQDESLDAWVEKLIESDQMLSAFGEDFINNSAELTRELQEAGLSAEQVESVINKLGSAIEQKKNSVEADSKAVVANTTAINENSDSVSDLSDNLTELWANKYGADGLVKKFNMLGVSINATTLKVAAFGAAFYAATIGVKNFVDANLDALDEIKQLSNVTGESADQIYLLGKVAEVNGSSAQAAQSSIEGLSRVIGEAAAGVGRGAKSFEQYGLSAKKANGEIKSSSELFGEISEKMQKMSDQEQIAMLAKLGIDGSMIQTLRLGNDELAEQIALAEALTLGVGNAENAEKAAAFKDALTQVSQVFIAIGEYVSLRISPSIQRLAERFTKWFAENNSFIKTILNGFGKVLSFLFELAAAIDNVIESTVGWKAVIIALGGLLLWFSRRMLLAFATNPITLAIAAIAGLILIIDDFITWLQGGDAQFADFYQSVADGLQWISDKWGELSDWIKAKWGEAIAWVTGKWSAFTSTFSIDNLKKTFESVKQTIIDRFKEAFGWAIDLWNSIVAKIGGEPINIHANVSTQGVRQAGLGVADLALNAGVYARASEVSAGGVGGTSNSDNSVKNSNNKITITQHIQGVDNPKAVADQSARAINNQLSPVIG